MAINYGKACLNVLSASSVLLMKIFFLPQHSFACLKVILRSMVMEMSQCNFIHTVTQNTRASYGTQTWISSDVPCNDS